MKEFPKQFYTRIHKSPFQTVSVDLQTKTPKDKVQITWFSQHRVCFYYHSKLLWTELVGHDLRRDPVDPNTPHPSRNETFLGIGKVESPDISVDPLTTESCGESRIRFDRIDIGQNVEDVDKIDIGLNVEELDILGVLARTVCPSLREPNTTEWRDTNLFFSDNRKNLKI